MRPLALSLLLVVACVPPRVPEPLVKASNGSTCQGASYPADAPCLEKGDLAPFPGLLHPPELDYANVAERDQLRAENVSLKHSLELNVGIIATAIGLIIAAGIGGYELGHATK